MSTSHLPTPGPWHVEGSTVYSLNAEGTNRFFAFFHQGWGDEPGARTPTAEVEAVARLAATAPELRDALSKLLGAYERLKPLHYSLSDAEKQARAALSKAVPAAQGDAS